MEGFVSKDGRVGYRFIPKVACTTIKHALYELEEKKEYSREEIEKTGKTIHAYVNKNKVSTMDQCQRRFIVIRDPIKRFLSAYSNRVTFHKELSKTKILRRSKKYYHQMPFFDPSLDQFIEHLDIYLNVTSIEHHTKPIVNFLEGNDLSYFTDVYKIEELANFEAELSDLFDYDVAFGHKQTGGKKFSLKDLSKKQVEKLVLHYQEDYELLREYYSAEDLWQEWEKDKNNSLSNQTPIPCNTNYPGKQTINKEERPLISVLLPAYNAEKTICTAVDSILSQNYENFELIIIDDGSTDKTSQILASTYDDFRIKHIILADNTGVTDTLNLAISKASGQYLARMDADDVSLPERFSKQIKFLEANPDYVACGSAIIMFNNQNAQCPVSYPCTHNEIMSALHLFSRNITHPAVVMRSECFKIHNLQYPRNYDHAEDYMLWKQLANYGKLYNLKEPLLFYRNHNNQVSSKHRKIQLDSSREILKIYLEDFLNNQGLNFSSEVYINFLVHEANNKKLTLSPAEAKGAFKDLLAHSKQKCDIDTRHAKKIMLYKYLRASVHYNHSNFQKIKTVFYCLTLSPNLLIQNLLEAAKLFSFRRSTNVNNINHGLIK